MLECGELLYLLVGLGLVYPFGVASFFDEACDVFLQVFVWIVAVEEEGHEFSFYLLAYLFGLQ